MRLFKYMWKQKQWFYNMQDFIISYEHMSEANYDRFLHMTDKQRIDRVCCDSRVWRFR